MAHGRTGLSVCRRSRRHMVQRAELEEQLEGLKELNKVLEALTHVEREPMSMACASLLDAIVGEKDPLVRVSDSEDNPYLRSVRTRRRCCCC